MVFPGPGHVSRARDRFDVCAGEALAWCYQATAARPARHLVPCPGTAEVAEYWAVWA
jgi:hypothetical protein